MYTQLSEEDDNKMADRWQKNADGILIFVSSYIDIYAPMILYTGTL
jgi:hypothetical protein